MNTETVEQKLHNLTEDQCSIHQEANEPLDVHDESCCKWCKDCGYYVRSKGDIFQKHIAKHLSVRPETD